MNDAKPSPKSFDPDAKSAQGHDNLPCPDGGDARAASDKSTEKDESQKHRPRDNATLRFIGLHKLLIHIVWSKVFLGDERKQCGHIAKRLEQRKEINVYKRKLPGGISYVTLTADLRRQLGLPKERAGKLAPAALDIHLAILWFCTMGSHPRYKLAAAELSRTDVLGESAPNNTVHVLSEELDRPRIFRIYTATTDATSAARQLRNKIRELRAAPAIGSWLDAGDYGFAVLGETQDKVVALKEAIGRLGLAQVAPIVVGLGPTSETLASVIKQRRQAP